MEVFTIKKTQKEIAELMGMDELCVQTAEELSELSHALLSLRRTRGNGQPTDKAYNKVMDSVCEEIVDCIICIKELIYMANISEDCLEYIERQKIARTANRYKIYRSKYD